MICLRKTSNEIFLSTLKGFYNKLRLKFPVYNLQSKIFQWKISPYGKYIIITKQKVKIL